MFAPPTSTRCRPGASREARDPRRYRVRRSPRPVPAIRAAPTAARDRAAWRISSALCSRDTAIGQPTTVTHVRIRNDRDLHDKLVKLFPHSARSSGDRAFASGAKGRRFKSCRARQKVPVKRNFSHLGRGRDQSFGYAVWLRGAIQGAIGSLHCSSPQSLLGSPRSSRNWSNGPFSTASRPRGSSSSTRVSWRLWTRSAGSSENRITVQIACSSM